PRSGALTPFTLGSRGAPRGSGATGPAALALPPNWTGRLLPRLGSEPASTVLVTTQVNEPAMPDDYLARQDVRGERYLSTFRGCGSLVRRAALLRAGGYDERFFIYGNERDLSARLLSDGGRILLAPEVVTFHATPFGLKAGRRSLYYHVRNFWLYAFKNCAWSDVLRAAVHLARKALLGARAGGGDASEATGTIGLDQSLRATPGGFGIAVKATLNALLNLP